MIGRISRGRHFRNSGKIFSSAKTDRGHYDQDSNYGAQRKRSAAGQLQKGQVGIAKAQFIPARQRRRFFQPLTVEEGAVGGVKVFQNKSAAKAPLNARMMA